MSETFWQRLVCGVRRVWQRSDWAPLVGEDWAERILQQEVTDDFHAKQGRSTGRWVIQHQDRRLTVYLKRHYRLPWWQGLLAALWPGRSWSPAMQELHHLQWAQQQGLPVPKPVAAVEYVGPWGRLRSMLAIEELSGMLPLHQAIPLAAQRLTGPIFRQWKKGLVAEVARLARELHRRSHFHKDLYLCHFYLPQGDIEAWRSGDGAPPEFRGRLHLIDLHRLGYHPWARLWWQIKDLAQLLYSSDVAGVTVQDRVLFWRLYRAGRRRGLRWLETLVRLRWRRYRNHNQKRARRERRTETTAIRTAA